MSTVATRLTPRDYFETALRILAEGSHDDITIAALCDALSVSKGSFYHHFGSLNGFIEAFLAYWMQQSELNEEHARRLESQSERRLFLLSLGDTISQDAEAAIRVWAQTDSVVHAAMAQIDDARVRMLEDFFALHLPKSEARDLSELHNAVIVWCQLRTRPVDNERMRQLFRQLGHLSTAAFGSELFFQMSSRES